MAQDNITLSLTVDQVNLILGALAELPFRTSADMINEVRTQAQAQIQQEQAPGNEPNIFEGVEEETPPAPKPKRKA